MSRAFDDDLDDLLGPFAPDDPEPPRPSFVGGGTLAAPVADAVPWLWYPYLAFGALSVLDGDPGVGKSLLTTDLAARLSSARRLPDGSEPPRNPVTGSRAVTAVFVAAEDAVRHTIIPRILAAGGNPGAAVFLGGVDVGGPGNRPVRLPDDLPTLRATLRELPGSLVVLDPFPALLPKELPAACDQCAREVLTPLARIAAESKSCVVLVRHLTKRGTGKALYRGGGSVAILGACRTGLIVGRHPDDPDRRVLAVTKSNLGPAGASLAFRVCRTREVEVRWPLVPGEKHPVTGEEVTGPQTYPRRIPSAPACFWDGPTPITGDDLCTVKPDHTDQIARAASWLKQLLTDGPKPATEVEAQAVKEGYAFRTVRDAKQRLRVESRRTTVDGVTRWEWLLPSPGDTPPAELQGAGG